MNVAVLYAAPGSREANGVGVFAAWEKSKEDPDVHLIVRYLVYWVAGVKVIFLALLAVIVVTGSERTTTAAGGALAVSVAVFFCQKVPPEPRSARRDDVLSLGAPTDPSLMLLPWVRHSQKGLGQLGAWPTPYERAGRANRLRRQLNSLGRAVSGLPRPCPLRCRVGI
jgi:hypothetical protein